MCWTLQHYLGKPQPRLMDPLTLHEFESFDTILSIILDDRGKNLTSNVVISFIKEVMHSL